MTGTQFLFSLWLLVLSASAATWPNGPLVTSGRWITDASGVNVTYAGVNWPGHAESMIPEGLQYQSIADIVGKIKSLGMNAVRLTFATEMVDQIYDNGGKDILILTAFINALGRDNGTKVYEEVLAKNPSFGSSTTRLEVFDAVAAECAKQNIYVHLDNHVSKAMWCCTPWDGNTWWGDKYFPASNWTRGLTYMANHGKAWPSLTSMSLRNELRQPLNNMTFFNQSYNWQYWYEYTKQGASAINKANPGLLIFISGMDGDTTVGTIVRGTALTPGTGTFDLADFSGYTNKLVLEIHNYEGSVANCTALQERLYNAGFQGLDSSAAHQFPVMMTEFGFAQDNNQAWKGVYASCLRSYLPSIRAGWMIWVLSGSYYVREGKQDYDEGWGLLNHDWSDWRLPEHINGGLVPMVNATLASLVTSSASGGSGSGNGSSSAGNSTGSSPNSHGRGRYDSVGGVLFATCVTCLSFCMYMSL